METLSDGSSLRIERAPLTLRELALERMRTAILDFRFRPGQRLVERDLCERLGVSRSVVREVIRHLEAEGLVQSIPHHGPSVALLDADTVAQIYDLRAILESTAAAAAALHASGADKIRMKKRLEDIEAAYTRKDFASVLRATNLFYETMFTVANKTVAWEMVQRLNGRISWLRSLTISSSGRENAGPRQLKKILQAINAGDADAAAAACRSHLATAGSIAQQMLANHMSCV